MAQNSFEVKNLKEKTDTFFAMLYDDKCAKIDTLFWPIFANFQNEADLFFMSWCNFRFLLSNPSQVFKIDTFFLLTGTVLAELRDAEQRVSLSLYCIPLARTAYRQPLLHML